MVATVEDGAITALKPDREHPVSRGFACHKGLNYLEIHNDPDRVNHPMRRTSPRGVTPATFEQVSWDEALSDIGARLRHLRETQGPNAIGTYYGNPVAFNTRAVGLAAMLPAKIGTRNGFGAASQDLTNKAAALEAMYGTTQWTIPDFSNTDYLLCFGGNPKISHWTLVSVHRPMHVLQDITARGGKVLFFNPRKIESASDTTGEVIRVKPDSDIYLIAALIHEIDAMGGFDEAAIAAKGKHIEGLRAFVARYPAERVAHVVGMEADDIRTIAREFMEAPRASVYMATGVNQGRQGTLAYWLLNMLSFVTGNMGRDGGNYFAKGINSITIAEPPEEIFFDTQLGPMRHIFGQLPTCMMPDFIELEDDPVRAMIVISGNPVLSVPGEDRIRKAFETLDLIVAIDLFRNATGEMADYILPSADWLEREDINHIANGVQPTPYIQIADRLVPPQHERRDDWWIIARIEQEMGLPSMLDDGEEAGDALVDMILSQAGLDREGLRALPHQTKLLPQPARDLLYDEMIAWPDKRVDCCPSLVEGAFDRCEALFGELDAEPDGLLKMISLRTNYMHNSNLANMRSLKRGDKALNPLHIHPADAAARGLADGDVARIFNEHGSVVTAIRHDDDLLPGVVALSHGYGHERAPGISRANSLPGVNVNRLLPSGAGTYEPISNMSHMNGVIVQVERDAPPLAMTA
jgi:anaerobic selenocysteine-containing dehydrogenase